MPNGPDPIAFEELALMRFSARLLDENGAIDFQDPLLWQGIAVGVQQQQMRTLARLEDALTDSEIVTGEDGKKRRVVHSTLTDRLSGIEAQLRRIADALEAGSTTMSKPAAKKKTAKKAKKPARRASGADPNQPPEAH